MEKKKYKKRNLWGKDSELVLIDIWRGKIEQLRGERKNSHILEIMAVELEELGVSCTPAEIKSKMHNLMTKYRKEKDKIGPSGGAPSDWPLYKEMHQLLAPYKSYNAEDLVEDSIYENVEILEAAAESPTLFSATQSDISPTLSSACSSPAPSSSATTRSSGKKSFQIKFLEKIDRIEKEMEKTNQELEKSDIELKECNKAFLESEKKKNQILEEYVNDNKKVNKAIIDFLRRD